MAIIAVDDVYTKQETSMFTRYGESCQKKREEIKENESNKKLNIQIMEPGSPFKKKKKNNSIKRRKYNIKSIRRPH